MKRHVEILPARKYYRRENPGHYSRGSVVLVNGHCEFHGTTRDAKAFYNKLVGPMYGPDVIQAAKALIRMAKERNLPVADFIESITQEVSGADTYREDK